MGSSQSRAPNSFHPDISPDLKRQPNKLIRHGQYRHQLLKGDDSDVDDVELEAPEKDDYNLKPDSKSLETHHIGESNYDNEVMEGAGKAEDISEQKELPAPPPPSPWTKISPEFAFASVVQFVDIGVVVKRDDPCSCSTGTDKADDGIP